MENTTHFSRAVNLVDAACHEESRVSVDIVWLLLETFVGFTWDLLHMSKWEEEYVTFIFFSSSLSVMLRLELWALYTPGKDTPQSCITRPF